MILQLAFVLTAIIIGARLGGIGLGVMGGVGLGILTFVFWFTTHRTTYRRYVDDCRRYFRCLLYASSRRTGLYGEVGGTAVAP